MAEDAIRLRDWIQDNAGQGAQSMPITIRGLWLMDRERWEAYEREHTPNTLEEGVKLVLCYLKAAIKRTATQLFQPKGMEQELPLPPPPEGEQQELPLPLPPEGDGLLFPPPPSMDACPGDSLLLTSEDLLRLEEPAQALSAHQLIVFPPAAYPLPVVQREEELATLSACLLTALPVAAWLLATLPPMNPLKSLFLARDLKRDFGDFKGGGGS
ncbi:UNVERIFIED_CONTAM: hypothetical protein FKN15_047857 [Acipenser sinensis]